MTVSHAVALCITAVVCDSVTTGAIPLCYPNQLKVYSVHSEYNKYFIINL